MASIPAGQAIGRPSGSMTEPERLSNAGSEARRLIINADDFGQSAGINNGIIRCRERGILTSASLMVRWPDAPAAAKYARTDSALSLGLHIDFGEWAYQNGEWVLLYEVVPREEPTEIRAEVVR